MRLTPWDWATIFPAPKLLLHGCEVPRLLQDHHGECHNTLLSQPWWDDFILACSFCLILYFPFTQLPPACRCSRTLRRSLSVRDVPPCSANPLGAGQGLLKVRLKIWIRIFIMTDVFQDAPSERRAKSKFFWWDLLEVQSVKRETISECKGDVNPIGGDAKI